MNNSMDFHTWCHLQLSALHPEDASLEIAVKKVVKSLIRAENCAGLLGDLIDNHAKVSSRLKIQQSDDQTWLRRKIFRLLKKTIRREYQIYRNTKKLHDFYLISDESNESNTTKSHSRTPTPALNNHNVPATACLGHPVLGDKVAAVVDVYTDESGDQSALIEWRPRKNGTTPQASVLQISDLLYFRPNILQDQKSFRSESIQQKLKALVKGSKETHQ